MEQRVLLPAPKLQAALRPVLHARQYRKAIKLVEKYAATANGTSAAIVKSYEVALIHTADLAADLLDAKLSSLLKLLLDAADYLAKTCTTVQDVHQYEPLIDSYSLCVGLITDILLRRSDYHWLIEICWRLGPVIWECVESLRQDLFTGLGYGYCHAAIHGTVCPPQTIVRDVELNLRSFSTLLKEMSRVCKAQKIYGTEPELETLRETFCHVNLAHVSLSDGDMAEPAVKRRTLQLTIGKKSLESLKIDENVALEDVQSEEERRRRRRDMRKTQLWLQIAVLISQQRNSPQPLTIVLEELKPLHQSMSEEIDLELSWRWLIDAVELLVKWSGRDELTESDAKALSDFLVGLSTGLEEKSWYGGILQSICLRFRRPLLPIGDKLSPSDELFCRSLAGDEDSVAAALRRSLAEERVTFSEIRGAIKSIAERSSTSFLRRLEEEVFLTTRETPASSERLSTRWIVGMRTLCAIGTLLANRGEPLSQTAREASQELGSILAGLKAKEEKWTAETSAKVVEGLLLLGVEWIMLEGGASRVEEVWLRSAEFLKIFTKDSSGALLLRQSPAALLLSVILAIVNGDLKNASALQRRLDLKSVQMRSMRYLLDAQMLLWPHKQKQSLSEMDPDSSTTVTQGIIASSAFHAFCLGNLPEVFGMMSGYLEVCAENGDPQQMYLRDLRSAMESGRVSDNLRQQRRDVEKIFVGLLDDWSPLFASSLIALPRLPHAPEPTEAIPNAFLFATGSLTQVDRQAKLTEIKESEVGIARLIREILTLPEMVTSIEDASRASPSTLRGFLQYQHFGQTPRAKGVFVKTLRFEYDWMPVCMRGLSDSAQSCWRPNEYLLTRTQLSQAK